MNPSRIDHPDAIESARVRELVRQTIEDNPGITATEVAQKLGRRKATVYQHIGILRAQGKLISAAMALPDGKYGKQLGYSITEDAEKALDAPSRFDYPSQTSVAAMDHAKLPEPCPLMNALFGRNKETA